MEKEIQELFKKANTGVNAGLNMKEARTKAIIMLARKLDEIENTLIEHGIYQ